MHLERVSTLLQRARTALVCLLSGLLLVVGGASLGQLDASAANIANTRVDAWGTLELSGSGWLGGGGVDVYSNGAYPVYSPDKPSNTVTTPSGSNVTSGEKWQCVELVNRLYLTKGWISTRWSGDGAGMYASAPSGLSKEAQNSITYINPGDVIVLNDGGHGHVGIIDSVVSSGNSRSVSIVNQNTQAVWGAATWNVTNKTLSSYLPGYSVTGVVHSPGGASVSNPAPQTQMLYYGDDSGKVYETYWGGGNPLTTSAIADVGVPVTAVSSQITSDGVRHVFFGTSGGDIYETYWGSSVSRTTAVVTNIGSGVLSLSSQIDSGVRKIYTGAQDGKVRETYWGGGNSLTSSVVANIGSPVTSLSSRLDGTTQSVYSGTYAGGLYETYWGGGNPLTTSQLASFGGTVSSVSSQFDSGVRKLYAGTSAGKVYETYWGGGNPLTTSEIASLGSAVSGVSSHLAGNVQTVFSATASGVVYETYWGSGITRTTASAFDAGAPVTALSTRIDDGIRKVYTATSTGKVYETYWGAGVPKTSSQVANTGVSIGGISTKLE